ncbi:MAG: hypothetical protein HYX89_05240 [Chloroflexi bacterium]|nr:hypothetical protein [Chloroflexota bacterium]
MRRYSSFIVRRWQLSEAGERIEVEHIQSGRRASFSSLAEAMQWMEDVGAQEGGNEIRKTKSEQA